MKNISRLAVAWQVGPERRTTSIGDDRMKTFFKRRFDDEAGLDRLKKYEGLQRCCSSTIWY